MKKISHCSGDAMFLLALCGAGMVSCSEGPENPEGPGNEQGEGDKPGEGESLSSWTRTLPSTAPLLTKESSRSNIRPKRSTIRSISSSTMTMRTKITSSQALSREKWSTYTTPQRLRQRQNGCLLRAVGSTNVRCACVESATDNPIARETFFVSEKGGRYRPL